MPRNESRWKSWCWCELVHCSQQVLPSRSPALVTGWLWARCHSLDNAVISATALEMAPAGQNHSCPGSALPLGVTVIPYGPYPTHWITQVGFYLCFTSPPITTSLCSKFDFFVSATLNQTHFPTSSPPLLASQLCRGSFVSERRAFKIPL